MPRDVAELVERYLSEDPTQWGRLASDIQWRRLQLLLMREILLELRDLPAKIERRKSAIQQVEPSATDEG